MVLLKILIKLVLKIKSLKIIMGNILGNSDLLNNSIDSMVLSTMMFLLKNISKKNINISKILKMFFIYSPIK